MGFKVLIGGLIVTLMLTSARAGEAYLPNPATAGLDQAPLIDIRNARGVFPGILSGGQPTDEQLAEAQAKGFKTVINLRTAGEMQGSNEATIVRDLGMHYITIPVGGAADINRENSQALITALADADQYPVLVHCASGNRVGALFALDAAADGQLPVEQALAVGTQTGMTRLAGVVRSRIEQERASTSGTELRGDIASQCDSSQATLTLAASSTCD
ncbi:MAG: sulfur transferase domain-containing protein [Immundisolibacteraceae bacterium]|nr:sulfur transferase domain-containing protein [Immundisolibacteraceae bacterium]